MITTYSATQPFSFYGIENLYGNIWKWIDGINIQADNNPWIADNNYADDTFTAPYVDTGLTLANTSGYVKAIEFDSENDYFYLASDATSSSSEYLCDFYYQAEGTRAACFGGYWYAGATAGLFAWDLSFVASSVHRLIGARLAFSL